MNWSRRDSGAGGGLTPSGGGGRSPGRSYRHRSGSGGGGGWEPKYDYGTYSPKGEKLGCAGLLGLLLPIIIGLFGICLGPCITPKVSRTPEPYDPPSRSRVPRERPRVGAPVGRDRMVIERVGTEEERVLRLEDGGE